jgi:hypothetical protein
MDASLFFCKQYIPYEIGEIKMFVVHFYENKNQLLNQLLKRVPSVGDDIKIKGRKGTVSSVNTFDEKNIRVQVILEKVNKNKLIDDDSKKKKGK